MTLDAVDLVTGVARDKVVRSRFLQFAANIVVFAVGCAVSAFLFWLYGFWCLLLAVLIGAAAAAVAQFKSH